MFPKLSFVTTLALVPWVNAAIFLQLPVDWHSSSNVNISWTSAQDDPPFSLLLVNSQFHDTFALANNVNPSARFIAFLLGVVPVADNYRVRAINPGNVSDIKDETPDFAIGAPLSSTSSSTTSTTTSGASNQNSTGIITSTSPLPPSSTSSFGTTLSNTSPTQTSSSGSTTDSGSTTASGPGSQPSSFNAAATLPRSASYAMAAVALVAGAVFAL